MKKSISLILITAIFSFVINYFPVSYSDETIKFPESYSSETLRQSVAILDLEAKGVSKEEASIITDRFRAHLVNTGKFKVMERSNMDKILKEQGFQQTEYCNTTECTVKIGHLLSVNTILTGSVTKLGGIYSINVRMLDVQTGQISKEEFEDCKCPIEDVLSITTKNITYKITNDGTFVPQTQPSPQIGKTDKEKSDRVKLYKQEEKWWGVGMSLNSIPFLPVGYVYLNDWWILGTTVSIEALSFMLGVSSNSSTGATIAISGLLSSWIFSIVYAPFSAGFKNQELMRKYGLTEEDIKRYSAKDGIIDFYAGKPSNGFYVDFNSNIGLLYRLNF